jgi:dihydroneopterin aldolase
MVVIELQHVRLQAYHGVYEGEKKTGSPYEVNVRVVYMEKEAHIDSLKHTVNYVDIFNIVKIRMAIPTPLLEQVAEGIIHTIRDQYPFTSEIIVSIYKLEAPIENFEGKVGVTIHKHFDE